MEYVWSSKYGGALDLEFEDNGVFFNSLECGEIFSSIKETRISTKSSQTMVSDRSCSSC